MRLIHFYFLLFRIPKNQKQFHNSIYWVFSILKFALINNIINDSMIVCLDTSSSQTTIMYCNIVGGHGSRVHPMGYQ